MKSCCGQYSIHLIDLKKLQFTNKFKLLVEKTQSCNQKILNFISLKAAILFFSIMTLIRYFDSLDNEKSDSACSTTHIQIFLLSSRSEHLFDILTQLVHIYISGPFYVIFKRFV